MREKLKDIDDQPTKATIYNRIDSEKERERKDEKIKNKILKTNKQKLPSSQT